MANLMHLRLAARQIFEEALLAVDAAAAVRNATHLESSRLTICDKDFELPSDAGVFAVAMGKAASVMAVALEAVLGDRLFEGVIAGPRMHAGGGMLSRRWRYFEGGHPLPNEASLAAADAVFELLDRANKEAAFLIFLISGGGSAMLEAPINREITLNDLRSANQTLVSCGASIGEINAVRRAFSAVKGGRLAMRAPNSQQVTLIVSDVPSGQEWNVASGPTLPPPDDAPRARDVIAYYGLRAHLPDTIIRVIDNPETTRNRRVPESNRHVRRLLDNDDAMLAAADSAMQRGFETVGAIDIKDGPIEIGCQRLLTTLAHVQSNQTGMNPNGVCVISGGEFACPVRGEGLGGRNLETALRLAIGAEEHRDRIGEFVALCAGTDGLDGNSPAAGAIVDSTTIERARRIGLDPTDFLNRSDSHSFFVALGDLITTGPTGTNVRDVRILLAGQAS